MLHIVNGTSTEQTLRQTSLQGECFSFRDALINGPTPANLNDESWRRIRAEHLAGSYAVDRTKCLEDLKEQERVLASFPDHEEVTLWFEHDLFCQLNLLYLLDWFSTKQLSSTRLSLINIGKFAGRENFRGLGELNREELSSLFPERREVTQAQLSLGSAAWKCYCSPDASAIEKLLASDTSPLPFLSTALMAHLQRFPSTTNGLGRIENRCLELIHNGFEKFVDLFPAFALAEPIYGLGDAQLWLDLLSLSTARVPLLEAAPENAAERCPSQVMPEARFKLTGTGRAVLRNETSFVALNDIDVWLGGVHLDRGNVWYWDQDANQLRPPRQKPAF